MNTARTLSIVMTLATLTAACGVNEFDKYRADIHSAAFQTVVTQDIELFVADSPIYVDPGAWGPGDAANAASESYIVGAFRDRLGRYVAPDDVAPWFQDVLSTEVVRGTAWRLVRGAEVPDVRIITTVEDLRVEIDELGLADVTFRMEVRGVFEPTGALIYQSWGNHTAPLTAPGYRPDLGFYGDDPAAIAAERAWNLQLLDDISGPALRDLVIGAAEDAAAGLAREVVQDVYSR